MIVNKEYILNRAKATAPATKAYSDIISSWIDETNAIQYPDEYGGSYIRDDDKLVVKVVNDNERFKEDVRSITKGADIIFEPAPVSYNYLRALSESISELELPTIVGGGVSHTDSKVLVYISKEDDNLFSTLGSLADSKYIKTVIRPQKVMQSFICEPGGRIMNKLGNNYNDIFGSIGWQGTFQFGTTQSPCILTAGHIISDMRAKNYAAYINLTQVLSSTQMKSTNYTYSIYDHATPPGGNNIEYQVPGDFGYLRTDANGLSMAPSNSVLISFTESIEIQHIFATESSNMSIAVGTEVYKGMGKSNASVGKITNSDGYDKLPLDADGKQYCVKGLVFVEPTSGALFSESGDSGCSVYYFNNNVPTLLGIVTAGPETPGAIDNTSDVTTMKPILNHPPVFIPYLG